MGSEMGIRGSLKAAGKASVINFVSGSALGGIAYTGPYSAAKGAIGALTKVAAMSGRPTAFG